MFAAFILIFALASFSFAGDIQCPDTEPTPPDEDGRASQMVIVDTDQLIKIGGQFLKAFWDYLT